MTGSAEVAARSARSAALVHHGEARVAETERKVVVAAMQIVAEEGPAAITIERVAARSGVARSTIYRHWHHVDDLVVDACRTLTRPQPVALSGEPVADLQSLAADYARELDEPAFFAVLVFLMDASRRSRALLQLARSLQRERQRRVVGVVRTGVGRGQLAAATEPSAVADTLLANLFHRRMGRHVAAASLDPDVVVAWALAAGADPIDAR